MALTTLEIVRKFLPGLTEREILFYNVPVTLNAAGSGYLPRAGLVSGSEVVKRLSEEIVTGPLPVNLPAETWIALPSANIVARDTVVANNWRLTTVFDEGRDYVIDPSQGKIRRIDGGGIDAGSTVQVWVRTFEAMTKDVDYTINYAAGFIARTAGSPIPPNATLLVDFEINAASVVEDLIPEAITQAEDKIARRLKPEFSTSSSDQGLQTGATELALAIISRSMATQALADGLPAASSRSRVWLELAVKFEASASAILKPFMTVPSLSRGGLQANVNWGWE